MLKNVINNYTSLGKYTKIIIKLSAVFVFTALFFSITSYIFKDFSNQYFFFYKVAEELLIVTRSCTFLGLLFFLIFSKCE